MTLLLWVGTKRSAQVTSLIVGIKLVVIVFFPYIGFDAVSTAAEEAKHPQQDVPIAILGSLGFCLLLYMAVAAVLTGIIPIDQIDIHAPVADALKQVGYSGGAILVGMGAPASPVFCSL
ncbi:MAG: amino acid permease [Nitrospirales bacterium]